MKRTLVAIGLGVLAIAAALRTCRSAPGSATAPAATVETPAPTTHRGPARALGRHRVPVAAPPPVAAVDLEEIGVVHRLEHSRHDLVAPAEGSASPHDALRFTVDREPLVALARHHETITWPVPDGEVEVVKLRTFREQDGNVFIGGDVVGGAGDFTLVMTGDNWLTGQLSSASGLYAYGTQLDEIVGLRRDPTIPID